MSLLPPMSTLTPLLKTRPSRWSPNLRRMIRRSNFPRRRLRNLVPELRRPASPTVASAPSMVVPNTGRGKATICVGATTWKAKASKSINAPARLSLQPMRSRMLVAITTTTTMMMSRRPGARLNLVISFPTLASSSPTRRRSFSGPLSVRFLARWVESTVSITIHSRRTKHIWCLSRTFVLSLTKTTFLWKLRRRLREMKGLKRPIPSKSRCFPMAKHLFHRLKRMSPRSTLLPRSRRTLTLRSISNGASASKVLSRTRSSTGIFPPKAPRPTSGL